MKTPRFDAFPTIKDQTPPKPVKELHSPLDGMPAINPPRKLDPSEKTENVYKSTNQQAGNETNQQINKSVSPQVNKETNQQVNKSTKRFTTYLTEESIRAMKRLAIDTGKKDYELFQDAVDKYLKRKGVESS